MPELWDLYTKDGAPTGKTALRGSTLPEGCYHLVCHFWSKRKDGRFLVQQRSASVEHWPLWWALTGGSVVAGEDAKVGLLREIEEELGLIFSFEDPIYHVKRFVKYDAIFDIWMMDESALSYEPSWQCGEEVAAVDYMSYEELLKASDENHFIEYRKDWAEYYSTMNEYQFRDEDLIRNW